jgi:pimeloyl-ACP methyl ester carboxylesterase
MTGPTTIDEPTTRTLEAPGATLTWDVRRAAGVHRPLLAIGSPMGAGGFATLAGHFPDRTVVTYDPRGVDRSPKDDPTTPSSPDQHADDVHRLIAALGEGPVDVFASSGGAVNALALVAAHPEDVATLVAHEPPLAAILPDRDAALAASRDVAETYGRRGFGPAMAKFIALVMHEGPIDPAYLDRPDPDPAMFGLPTDDDGARTDALLMQNMISCTHYQPDIEALRAAPTRIVIGVGDESRAALAGRGGAAVAEKLGLAPVTFPGGHDGFLGGEYGSTGKPDAFAATLRDVLDAD